MTDTVALRRALTGLLGFAATEEQALLGAAAFRADSGEGSPDSWAAVPLVAHNNQFKHQQDERIRCVLGGRVPAAYGEIDHSSAQVYQGYLAQRPDAVLAECRQVTAQLIDGIWTLPDEDLLDPARHPWLNGRLLWLQIVVRGFWHPTGHLGEYYLVHGEPGQAVALTCGSTPAGIPTSGSCGKPAPDRRAPGSLAWCDTRGRTGHADWQLRQ